MRREQSKATSARAYRPVSVAPDRSKSAIGGIARRDQGDADRREDSPRRIVRGGAGGDRAGTQDSSDCECAEPVQYRGPQMGKNSALLRESGPRLYALVTDWGRQGVEIWRGAGSGCHSSPCDCCSGRACLASAPLAYDAANSRHVVDRAPGGKRRRGETQADSGRVENDGWFGKP